ncbi:hypothetical protein QJS10_CPB22g00774 [Acorus calamus]|uniref:Uncharacterized protein n=1 Tax=Acorus calamus TaxID=4465 RepID=A0AAV9C2A9_ACOCL|nr:hypothetical protein QJS10_CPB22g00774 [Acorus calamus]
MALGTSKERQIVRIKVEEADKTDENDIKDAILRHFQQAEKKAWIPMWSDEEMV